MKPVIGMIRTLFPVVYFGGLFFYFLDVADGSLEQAQEMGLGPYLLGLAIVGLLFSIPLIIKLVWLLVIMFGGRRSHGSGTDSPNGDGGFDADAVIARYKAQQSVGATSAKPPARSAPGKPSSFGRKTR